MKKEYKVIQNFKDLEDHNHIYKINDIFPHKDNKLENYSKERIDSLLTNKNRLGKPVIKEVVIEDDTSKEKNEKEKVEKEKNNKKK